MIRSFVSKQTEKVFNRIYSHKWPKSLQKIALRKLLILDAATDINDLHVPPGNRLERLKGKRNGQYSIRINYQWRICFNWKNNNAYNIEITDYH